MVGRYQKQGIWHWRSGWKADMRINRAYKTELNPNNKQRTMFHKCAGTARFVYNWGLAEWKRQYEEGEKPSPYGLCKQFNNIKDETSPWIREVPYAITYIGLGWNRSKLGFAPHTCGGLGLIVG
jgi:hypothetical protein